MSLRETFQRKDGNLNSVELFSRASAAKARAVQLRRDLARKCIESILQFRCASLIMTDDPYQMHHASDGWIYMAYERGDVTAKDMIVTRHLLPDNEYDDSWMSNRPQEDVCRRNGFRSFRDAYQVNCSRLQRDGMPPREMNVLEVGPGDGSLSNSLAKQNPTHKHFSYGDRMYFSLEGMLMQFVKPMHLSDLDEFVKIFLLFVKREFRKKYDQNAGKETPFQKTIDLNEIYNILNTLPDWIDSHFDKKTGSYHISKEFPSDTCVQMTPAVHQMFCAISSFDLLKFYSSIFSRPFVENLTLQSPASLDLNLCPTFYVKGFIPGKFEFIRKEMMKRGLFGKLDFVFGCRSDSHLPANQYVQFVQDIIALLAEGGTYDSDGVIKSYDRQLRYAEVHEMLEKEYGPSVRAFAVIDKYTRLPKSLFVEKGIDRENGFDFCTENDLEHRFDLSHVELVPLKSFVEEIHSLKIIREQSLQELGGDPVAFSGIHDVMEAAQIFSTLGGSLSEITRDVRVDFIKAGLTDVFEIFFATLKDIEEVRVRNRVSKFPVDPLEAVKAHHKAEKAC